MKISYSKAVKLLERKKRLHCSNFSLEKFLFSQQLDFIKDTSKLKALFCTRRAAKSYTAGMYLVYEALSNPGVNCLFLGLTRASAKGIVWKDILKQINKDLKLGGTFNATELTMTLPNGSIIYVTGADADEDEMNKLLGRKYKLVTIDEASMYTVDLRKMVYGILKPAMADMNGTICMMGTASNFTRGLFYDITNDKEPGWKLFTWTAHDNPFIAKQWQEELDEIDRLRPLFKETSLYRQWYLNKWEIDEEKRVYKFDYDKNTYKVLPTTAIGDWIYVLGVDTGWEDDNAFVLTAYNTADKNLFVVKTYNKSHMTFDQVVEKINEFLSDNSKRPMKVIIDGANKQGVESMRLRSSIPFEYAEKQGKVDFIEMLNADLIQDKIKINIECRTLIDEMMNLVWQTDGEKIRLPKKEHPSLPNHLCDAFLYAWRCGYHYAYTPVLKLPDVGSPEWAAQEEERMRTALYDRIKEDQQQSSMNVDFWGQNDVNLDKWRKS